MENKEAQPPHPHDAGKVPSFLAFLKQVPSWLRSPRLKRAEDQKTPARRQEREQLSSPIGDLYRRIDSAHPGTFSVSFAEGLCNEIDCLVDQLFSQAKSKEILAVVRDLTLARNEVVLAIDYLDPQEVDPLYRLVLRNKAILRLKNLLYEILRTRQSHGFPGPGVTRIRS